MKREQLVEKILDIKREKRWTWKHITEEGVVTLPLDEREASRLRNCHAAATAVRHVSIAAERSARCVWADVRWRWTLKVL
jgi:hypothetical protein